MLKKYYSAEQFIDDFDLVTNSARILNAGSNTTRFGGNCLNIDIQMKENVDLVTDMHSLPDDIGKFDAVICNAALQYCHSPMVVMNQFHQVLKPGGLLFIEAPWVQPYCDDTVDRFRFSEHGLLGLLEGFEIVRSGQSITPGSALVMQASYIAASISHNKYINFACSKAVETLLFPVHWINTKRPELTAGGHFVIARTPTNTKS